jgi:hypothetical protein
MVLAALVLLLIVVFETGVAIDLIHLREAPLASLALMVLLVAPPTVATWLWGRR